MIKWRPHRELFADAMAEMQIFASPEDLLKHLRELHGSTGIYAVEAYSGIDSRNGWDTHIVCKDGAAIGFTDCMVTFPEQGGPRALTEDEWARLRVVVVDDEANVAPYATTHARRDER